MIFSKTELREIQRNFPITNQYIFFNTAGVAPISLPSQKIIRALSEDLCKIGYYKLKEWNAKIPIAREEAAALINSSPEEIAFVKNTSHGLSLVAEGIEWQPGDEVIISDQEFPANVYPWLNLKKKGVKVVTIRSKNSRLEIDQINNALTPRTKLISLSSVEYATGFRNNLTSIGQLCQKHRILFCVDGIQSLGSIPMDVKRHKIDFLAADGHKWLVAPEGAGIFYCRKSRLKKLKLTLVGWNTVQNASNYHKINFRPKNTSQRFEEGSHNLIGIHALAASIKLLRSIGIERINQWNLYLTDILLEGLKDRGNKILSSTLQEYRSSIISFTTGSKIKDKLMFNHLIKNKVILSLRGKGLRLSPHLFNTPLEATRFFHLLDNF